MISEKGLYKELAYKLWKTDSKYVVVVIQGSGEFSTTTDGSDLDSFIDKNSYAQYAKSGTEFPFNILTLASYKKPGSSSPSQAYIMKYAAELVQSLGFTKAVLTGYSLGGQFTAGMLTKSLNSGQTETSYLGSDIWDGYVILCGKPPGSPKYCSHSDKPVLLVHGDADTSVNISNGKKIRDNCNLCVDRLDKANLITIAGGSHSSSWTKGYNVNDPVGGAVYFFIIDILSDPIPEPIEIPFDELVLVDQAVIVKFGDKKFRIAGDFI